MWDSRPVFCADIIFSDKVSLRQTHTKIIKSQNKYNPGLSLFLHQHQILTFISYADDGMY